MPVGNQHIWDQGNQGIGDPATNMLAGDLGKQSSGFNPMALSNQNNASQISTPATETPAGSDDGLSRIAGVEGSGSAPAGAAWGGGGQQQQQQQQQQGPNPKVTAAKNALDQAMLQFQQAQQVLGGNSNVYAKHAGMTLANWQRKLFEAQQRYQQAMQQFGG